MKKNTAEGYDEFLNENRRRINEQMNVILRVCIFSGPMIAIAVRFNLFADVTYYTAAFVSVFMIILTVVHKMLLKNHATSMITSMIALVAIDVLLVVMNQAHLTIYINWFLIPLLSLQFCDFRLYTLSVIVNYCFMLYATWDTAPWFAERRIDVDKAVSYFASRIGGLSIEMTMMIVAGFVLCKMITRYYKDLLSKVGQLDRSHKIQERLNGELSSMANIYYSAHDININDDTFFEICLNYDRIREIIGDEQGNARKLLSQIMDELTDAKSKPEVMRFIDFDTLDDRMRDEQTITLEFKGVTGSWSRGRFIVSERSDDGKISHVIWLVESIDTEKKQRDALIDMSERAIAASEAKSSFLSNMSHEIRTPINAVLGMNEMILRECEDNDIRGYSESIRTAGNTLLGLVNDILDFSKIEAGKMEIIPVDYDLSTLINDLVNMIQTRADAKGLELVLDFDREIPKLLHGDEVRIKQVITNILTNAVKYTEKGAVTFGIRYEKIAEKPDSVLLNVFVKDTGIGIKPEDMKKLFSEFERIEEDRNRNVEGTGLGMNITKSLLEMMGTTLKVESVYGLGSNFCFLLEQRVVEWEQLGDYEASYHNSVQGRSRYRQKFTAPDARVLVVDDTPMNLTVFKSLLKQTQVIIDTAESGNEGLVYTNEKKYDIIFLDHMMPDKDGIETFHELRSHEAGPNIDTPVICLTANAISGAREKYMAEGFDNYLTKPIDSDKLEDMLIQYLPDDKVHDAGDYDDNEYDINTAGSDRSTVSSDEDYGYAGSKDVLPDCVKESEELDVESGIRNNGGIENYLEMLKIYSEIAGTYANDIEEFMDRGDIANAVIKIHALKSTSRIIGAADMGELAQKLETAGKERNIELLISELDGMIERCRLLGDTLQELNGEEDKSLPEADRAMMDDIYRRIKEYAKDMDIDGIEEALEELDGYSIPDIDKNTFDEIKHAVDNFDYDRLGEIL